MACGILIVNPDFNKGAVKINGVVFATIEASTYVFTAFTEGYLVSDVPSKATSIVLLFIFSFDPKPLFTSVIVALNAN